MFEFLFRRRNRRRALWAQVAAEYGGTFHLPTGFFRPQHERIEATVDGAQVLLETYAVHTGQKPVQYTRVTGWYTRGPGPMHSVDQVGVFARVGKALGLDYVELGHGAFDIAFHIRAANPAVARRLWSPAAIDHMLARFPNATIKSSADTVELTVNAKWEDGDKLRAAITMIAELANRDLYGVDSLRAVADAAISQKPGAWPEIVLDLQARVVIRAEHPGPELVMVARVDEVAEREELVAEIVNGNASGTERLPQAALATLPRVGTGRLAVSRDGLSFTWPVLEVDPDHLRAGAELLGAIAAGHAGVYR